jgi:hypothetical protein
VLTDRFERRGLIDGESRATFVDDTDGLSLSRYVKVSRCNSIETSLQQLTIAFLHILYNYILNCE